jgi:hypothetical protein
MRTDCQPAPHNACTRWQDSAAFSGFIYTQAESCSRSFVHARPHAGIPLAPLGAMTQTVGRIRSAVEGDQSSNGPFQNPGEPSFMLRAGEQTGSLL